MKKCPSCQKTKAYTAFGLNKARKDGYKPYCKRCTKAKLERRRDDLLRWFQSLKFPFNCKVCGGFHPATLEFHFDDRKKDTSVLEAIKQGITIKKAQGIIDRCKILCANCHRKLHWKEKKNVDMMI